MERKECLFDGYKTETTTGARAGMILCKKTAGLLTEGDGTSTRAYVRIDFWSKIIKRTRENVRAAVTPQISLSCRAFRVLEALCRILCFWWLSVALPPMAVHC